MITGDGYSRQRVYDTDAKCPRRFANTQNARNLKDLEGICHEDRCLYLLLRFQHRRDGGRGGGGRVRPGDVYTALEAERLSDAGGPTGGKFVCRDGRSPESVAILHCIGSRDNGHNAYCSRVCCMYSMKLAHLVREKTHARVYEFYHDMAAYGKGYAEFHERVQEEGVIFPGQGRRGEPGAVQGLRPVRGRLS